LSKLNLSDISLQNQSRVAIDPDQLERLKQEHLKDLISESQMTRHQQYLAAGKSQTNQTHHFSDNRLPSRGNAFEKVYGNLNDVVAMEASIIENKRLY
jgi:hypothetical protein